MTALLPSKEEGTHMHAAVTHRRRLEGLREHWVRDVAEGADVAGQVCQPERPRKIAKELKEA